MCRCSLAVGVIRRIVVVERFNGIYGAAYDAIISRTAGTRFAGAAFGSATALADIPKLVCEAYEQKSDEALLDVPCGGFASLAHAAHVERSAKVVGVDLSKKMLARAKRRIEREKPSFEVELLLADALDVPVDDGYFGSALSVNGLHCMPNAQRFLSELARVVRPGDALTLTTLLESGGYISHSVNKAFMFGGVIPHLPPSLLELELMLKQAGFGEIAVRRGSALVALTAQRMA